MDIELFKKIGFSDKTALVYITLLRLGPSSVRNLADAALLNRGTAYDSLKILQEKGLVGFYHEGTKQTFVAENPAKLRALIRAQEEDLRTAEDELATKLPELQAIHNKGGERPIAKYYEKHAVQTILEDVLDTCERTGEELYRIYSVAGIREYLYDGFATFSDVRLAKGIRVRAIAIGEGGELRGLDERRWLRDSTVTPTYIIIYPGKTAYLSLNAKSELVGVVIENEGVFETQRIIFDELWQRL